MEAFTQLLVARTGYPRSGAIADAARDSGVAQSLLSQYVRGTLKPKPDTLAKLARYLERDYDELLLMVWGSGEVTPRPQPTTPHDQALRSVDVIAAAMTQLRSSLVAMAPKSQPHIVSRKKRSSTNYGGDYLYQTSVPASVLTGHPGFVQKITQLWPRRHRQQAA